MERETIRRGFSPPFFLRPPPSKKKTEKKRSYGMVVGAERALGPLVACGVEARKVVGSRRLIATAVFPGAAMPPPPPPSASAASASAASAASAALLPTPKPPRMIMSQVSEDDTDVDAPTARGALFMVDRAHLVASLARHVEEELSGSVSLHWGAPLASLDAAAQVARFGETGEEEQERRYDLLVACDGGSSAARRALEEAGLIEITELPSPVSLTDYKTFHGEEVFFWGKSFALSLSRSRRQRLSLSSPSLHVSPAPPPRNFSLSIRSRRRRRRRARSRHHWPRLHLCDVCSPSSPAGSEGSHVRFLALRFLAFPGGGGEEARQTGDEKLTFFSTASLLLAPSLSPPFHTQKKKQLPGVDGRPPPPRRQGLVGPALAAAWGLRAPRGLPRAAERLRPAA